jgi:hypothetical protein
MSMNNTFHVHVLHHPCWCTPIHILQRFIKNLMVMFAMFVPQLAMPMCWHANAHIASVKANPRKAYVYVVSHEMFCSLIAKEDVDNDVPADYWSQINIHLLPVSHDKLCCPVSLVHIQSKQLKSILICYIGQDIGPWLS